jgi:hypothetical protein
MFIAYFTLAICFVAGYFAWKIDRRYEAGKFGVIIKGKVDIFEKYDMYDNPNPIMATLNNGDKVKVLDIYNGSDFGGIEVELNDGRKGYIQFFRPDQNFELIKKED